jgi:hypothetical protein
MTNSNKDIEELEELLTELEGQEARLVSPYSEDDDAVTQLMDAPLGDQEWMVQVTPLDRRMMSTDQLVAEFHSGRLSDKTLVWRGGMDDWLPIQRVDELANAQRPAPSLASRMALGLPPPPAARPASQPLWAAPTSSPGAAPLPPPPAAMPPTATISNIGLPKPMSRVSPSSPEASPSNTTRPVALDFSEVPPEAMNPVQGKRALVALGAVGIMAVFVTFYALSSGGDAKPSAEAAQTAPQAVAALQPAAAKPAASVPAASLPAAPKMAAAASDTEPTEPSSEAKSSSSEAQAKSTAPAKYSLRSEYRKRSRSSSSSDSRSEAESKDDSSESQPAPTRASASEEQPADEAEAPADDDADSDVAPKSTGKSGNTFNREAAKSALDAAASQAKNCKPPGGPVGTGRVQVRYEPSGKVGQVSILTGKFANTTTGSCVQMLFRRAKVPEFTGAPVVVVNKSFEIP